MKAGWKIKKLYEVSDIFDGPHATPKTVEHGPIFLGIGALQDGVINLNDTRHVTDDDFKLWTRRVRPQANDVVFSYETRIGQAAIIPEGVECCLGRRMGLVRFRTEEVIPSFFLYQYISPSFREFLDSRTIRGATVDRLSIKDFPSFPIVVAPLPEQQRIVAILDEAFEAIAAARANAEQNRQNARAMFESYLQSVFSQRGEGWVDSGNVLSSMCELIVDCEHKTAPTQDEGFPSIRTPNIGKGKLLLDDVKRVSEETYRAWTRRAVPLPGDLIFAREAPAGNVAVVPDGLQPCLGQRTVLIRPKKEAFDSLFLTYLLLSPSMQEHLLSHSKGSTVQHINMKDIRALRLGGIPAIKEQRELARQITDCSMNCERLESLYQRKIEALDELKQSLLQQAFSGNL